MIIIIVLHRGRMKTTRRFLDWTITPALTLGAVLLLGLLSFTGMYVLYPILGLAIATFALSIFYEAEIYQQNITQALDKLLDKNILIQSLGKQALLELHPLLNNDYRANSFLQDYYTLLNLPKKTSGDRERLKKMERWFGQQLLKLKDESKLTKPEKIQSEQAKSILNKELQDVDWPTRYDSLRFYNRALIIFSIIAATLMSIGTIYLLLDTLSVLTFFSIAPSLAPFIIIPLAMIAGIAYGFLTYNSLSEFIFKSEMFDWIKETFQKFSKAETYQDPKNLLLAGFGLFVIALNIGLTICTAGTWWTIMNQSRPVWGIMKNAGIQILQKLTPIVISISTLGFNGQNTIQTIKQLAPHQHTHDHSKSEPKKPAPFNPFDYLLKILYFPFRLLMFMGHLVSISVTSDQMPGVPQFLAAFFAFVSEFLEDGHYFLDMEEIKSILGITTDECDDHEDGHKHSDIPNYLLQLIFSPVFLSAAAYDYFINQDPENPMDFKTCLYKKLKWEEDKPENHLPTKNLVSNNWLRIEATMLIDDQIEHLNSSYCAPELIEAKRQSIEAFKADGSADAFNTLKNNPIIKQHRFWSPSSQTRTEEMVDELDILVKQYSNPQNAASTQEEQSNIISIVNDTAHMVSNQNTSTSTKDISYNSPFKQHQPHSGECKEECRHLLPLNENNKSTPGSGWARTIPKKSTLPVIPEDASDTNSLNPSDIRVKFGGSV